MTMEINQIYSSANVYPVETVPVQNANGVVLAQILATLNTLSASAAANERTRPEQRVAAMMQNPFLIVDPFKDVRDHYLNTFSFFDNTVELEDGSFWKVNAFDMYKIRSWASNDILKITPNGWPFSSEYKITNTTTGDSVAADIYVGPVAFGPSTHWIVAIDPWLNRVYLENGTYWDVRGVDAHALSRWSVNDTVILGRGGDGWFDFHDSILINVEMNQYIYANKGF